MIRPIALLCCFAMPLCAQDLTGVPDDLGAQVVVLGEVHDNPLHHLGQAEMIRRLDPRAVVFEMLTPAQAKQVNADPRTDLDGLGARIGWATSGWPEYAIYQPVFEALGIRPVIGAAAPKDTVRQAFSDGASAVMAPDGNRFGLADALPADQLEQRKKMQFDAHCEAMPLDMMGGMVEAQRYRDAAFAQAVLAALETYGAPIVLIAGNGHARTDWGVPAMIALAAPEVSVKAIGFVEAPTETSFDITVVTDPAERDDPCARFNK